MEQQPPPRWFLPEHFIMRILKDPEIALVTTNLEG